VEVVICKIGFWTILPLRVNLSTVEIAVLHWSCYGILPPRSYNWC